MANSQNTDDKTFKSNSNNVAVVFGFTTYRV